MSARRIPTLLAVAVVAAVGVAALVDGLRPGEPEPVREETAEPDPDVARQAAALREAGAIGLLVVSRPDCRVDLLALPDLTGRAFELCAALGASGRMVSLDGRLPSPADNIHVASCTDEAEGVVLERGATILSFPGCAPAWRPDGLLTVVAEGEVWGFRPADSSTVRLLPGRKLRGLFDPSLPPGDRRSLEVREVVWSSETHLIAILRREVEPRYFVAAMSSREVLWSHCCFEDLRRLRLSPGGTFVDVESEDGALVYDSTGAPFPLEGGRPPEAVAWSPADRFLAVARAGSVTILEPGRSGLAAIARLPIDAADLRWVLSDRDVLFPEGTN
jgi:hypothetical protein